MVSDVSARIPRRAWSVEDAKAAPSKPKAQVPGALIPHARDDMHVNQNFWQHCVSSAT